MDGDVEPFAAATPDGDDDGIWSAPMPAHERAWRHPSEIAALASAGPDPDSITSRLMVVTTGAVGLALVVLLAVTITPGRGGQPLAVSATSTPVTRPTVTVAAARVESHPPAPFGVVTSVPLATPVGEGSYAVVTAAAVHALGPTSVELPSGQTVQGEVVLRDTDAGVAVVALSITVEAFPYTTLPGAVDHSTAGEMVTMLTPEPLEIERRALDRAAARAAEGTPVVDDEGALVGLCSHRDAGDDAIIPATVLADVTASADADQSPAPSRRS